MNYGHNQDLLAPFTILIMPIKVVHTAIIWTDDKNRIY